MTTADGHCHHAVVLGAGIGGLTAAGIAGFFADVDDTGGVPMPPASPEAMQAIPPPLCRGELG